MVCMDIINIYENYNNYFDDDLKSIFECCSKAASISGYRLYLIGGIVRDMLIGSNVVSGVGETSQDKDILRLAPQNDRTFMDIDITVEGDAIEFAHVLERECGAKILSVHKDFGTVKAEFRGKEIDFASTRSESYPRKGHLPLVEKIGCSLKEDVVRRDFTVNSLAVSLNDDSFANLIDYVGGFEDLKAKKIRILHDQSFIDDPTRIIRALKYSARLGFELDEQTLKLQEAYLKNINYDMCYKRVKQEIKKTFEQNFQTTFETFIRQGIYKLIINNEVKSPKTEIENLINQFKPKYPWLVYFGVLAIYSEDELLERLELTNQEKDVVRSAKELVNRDLNDDYELYKAFSAQKIETLLILAASGKEKEVFHYLNKLKQIELAIDGNDLLNLGYSPSKSFSEGFDYVLRAKIKNPQITKAEEIEIIKNYLS